MAHGFKSGGRRKGTPNKRTAELATKIKSKHKDFDPILELIDIYNNPETTLDVKTDILKNIAPYMYPKRKSISSDQAESETKMLIDINKVKYSRAQLMALLPPGFDQKWADVCSNEKLQQIITDALGDNIKCQFLEQFEAKK